MSKILVAFLDATNMFLKLLYHTTNLFLVQTFKVKRMITDSYGSYDIFMHKMNEPMYEKFKNYWGEIGLLYFRSTI
jgi:Domain of unknown function (DUF4413)